MNISQMTMLLVGVALLGIGLARVTIHYLRVIPPPRRREINSEEG